MERSGTSAGLGPRTATVSGGNSAPAKRPKRRWIRGLLLTLAGVIVIAFAALLVAAQLGERRLQRQVHVDVPAVALRDDARGVERGRYLFMSRGCTDCHGEDGGGKVVIDDGKGMLVRGPNITPVPNGVVASYQVVDWTRIIRHGVKPDGRPALIMPSEDYNRLTDDDLGSLIAYLKQMPPAQGGPGILQLPLLVKALYGAGAINDAAAKIDHRLPPATPVAEGVTKEHGAYVANACIGCHGPQLQGGRIPGAPPDWPPAADLRPGGTRPMNAYADSAAFARMMKTGKRPDGSDVSPVMPFNSLKAMSDTDVNALFLYLRNLEAGG